jgi:hypothetical protein
MITIPKVSPEVLAEAHAYLQAEENDCDEALIDMVGAGFDRVQARAALNIAWREIKNS